MKFVSHLDLQRTLQRAFRRAKLETLFSQGFNPHLKMSYTPPLPLFATSDEEYLDIELTGRQSAMEVYDSLSGVLPRGIIVNSVKQLFAEAKPLSSLFTKAAYEIRFSDIADAKQSAKELNSFFASAEEMPVTRLNKKRNEKTTDIKKQIYSFEATADGDDVLIEALIGCSNDDLLNPFVLTSFLSENVPILSDCGIKKVHKLYVE